MNAQAKALPVLGIIHGLSNYHGKRYCYPSQERFRRFLRDRVEITISIATFNRWLRAIEDAGLLKRRRRIRRDPKLGMVFKSTLYYLTLKGYMLLAKQGVAVWGKIKALAAEMRKKAGSKSKVSGKELGPNDLDYYKDPNIRRQIKEYLS